MLLELIINIVITGLCLFVLAMYFNRREKKLQHFTESKFEDVKGQYKEQVEKRKQKEKEEIEKLKNIVGKLQEKHKAMLLAQKNELKNNQNYNKEAIDIIKNAEKNAKKIEQEVREDARIFLEEQKKEVQAKMVDLVMGVTKKVLARSLDYDEQKELIEEAFLEVEGELPYDD